MTIEKAMDMICNVIAGKQEYLDYIKGYEEFEKAYENLKEEGQLQREEYKDGSHIIVRITSNYPSLMKMIRDNRKENK